MFKKTLKLSAFILTILAIALIVYYFMLSTNENVAGGKKPFFGNLFPFGNNIIIEPTFPTTTPVTTPEDTLLQSFEKVVRLISNEPVAGSTFVQSSTKEYVRYIEKATGHIFDVPTTENTNIRVSNTTIPQLHKALFTNDGSGFIAQYIKEGDTVETFSGKIRISEGEGMVDGTILSRNILDFTVSPDGKNLFTLEKTSSGSEGFISLSDGSSKKRIWISPLRELVPQFISNTQIGLYTKPDTSAYGNLFDINTANGQYTIRITNQFNLTTLPHTSKPFILYANTTGLLTINTQTSTTTTLSPYTFPEKCTWANTKTVVYCAVPKTTLTQKSLYAWYRGEVSFSDDIWEYDILENTARMITNLEDQSGRSIDVSAISINSKDTLLLIQSKLDGSLWSIRLEK